MVEVGQAAVEQGSSSASERTTGNTGTGKNRTGRGEEMGKIRIQVGRVSRKRYNHYLGMCPSMVVYTRDLRGRGVEEVEKVKVISFGTYNIQNV